MSDNINMEPPTNYDNIVSDLDKARGDYAFTVELAIALFQDSPDAIIVADDKGKIRLVNSQAEILSGYHKSELRDKPVEILVPEAKRQRHDQAHRPGFMEEPRMRPMGVDLDLKLRHKNGNEIPVDINLSPVVTIRGLFVITTIRKRRISKETKKAGATDVR